MRIVTSHRLPCTLRRHRRGEVCRASWNVAETVVLATSIVPLSIAADALVDRVTQRVARRCNTDADGVRCFVASPSTATSSSASPPVVLVLHEIAGLQDREVEFCQDLAKRGYVAIAVDMFRGRSSKWLPRIISFALEKVVLPSDPDYSVPEVLKLLKWLKTQEWYGPETPIGIIGFCYGGGSSIRSAIAAPGAFTSVGVFYGNPPAKQALCGLSCPVFATYGSEDAQFPSFVQDAFEEALRRIPGSQFLRLNGEGHAFVTNLEATRKEGAAQAAWKAYISFLDETLKS